MHRQPNISIEATLQIRAFATTTVPSAQGIKTLTYGVFIGPAWDSARKVYATFRGMPFNRLRRRATVDLGGKWYPKSRNRVDCKFECPISDTQHISDYYIRLLHFAYRGRTVVLKVKSRLPCQQTGLMMMKALPYSRSRIGGGKTEAE